VSCSKQENKNVQRSSPPLKERIAENNTNLSNSTESISKQNNGAGEHLEPELSLDLTQRVFDLTGKKIASGTTTFDENRTPLKTRFSDGSVVEYTRSLPVRFILASGQITDFQYDIQNHLQRITFPDGSFEAFVYDSDGKVKKSHFKSDGTPMDVR
jgi:YD repeat-containing protein